jgi:K+ transporter
LPILIYAAFYLSIKHRNRQFLINGSFFLVLFIITMAFKYFAGLGAAFGLAVSAVALLATAFMASSINKRYIKG